MLKLLSAEQVVFLALEHENICLDLGIMLNGLIAVEVILKNIEKNSCAGEIPRLSS